MTKYAVTGTFKGYIFDHRVPIEQDSITIATSPEFPGNIEGMEALRNWVRNHLATIVGKDWIKYSTATPFMTNEELDATIPGWRISKFHDEGNSDTRVIDRPPLDLSLDLTSMNIPLRMWDDFKSDFGVLIEGPKNMTEDGRAKWFNDCK